MEITPEMSIAEIFELAPDSVIIMENAGLKVTGCDARTDRTLSDLASSLNPDSLNKLLEHLNRLRQVDTSLRAPTDADFEIEKIVEGNKAYYKLAGLLITENAYKNLHQIADKKGLRLHLTTGGCSGFKYEFDYFDEALEGERTYKLSEKLAIYMDDFTFTKSQGAVVDFTFGLHSSGLQIINPNKKRSCSCGVSLSF